MGPTCGKANIKFSISLFSSVYIWIGVPRDTHLLVEERLNNRVRPHKAHHRVGFPLLWRNLCGVHGCFGVHFAAPIVALAWQECCQQTARGGGLRLTLSKVSICRDREKSHTVAKSSAAREPAIINTALNASGITSTAVNKQGHTLC